MTAPIDRLVLASQNPGKLRELRAAFAPLDVTVITPDDPLDVEETGETFDANATLKAVAFAQHTGLPALADDSGIAVDALDGAPGVYSARFAGTPCDNAANNALLLERLAALAPCSRAARFHCSLALVWPSDPGIDWTRLPEGVRLIEGIAPCVGLLVDAQTHGVILDAPRGEGGFGYDPLFLSDDLGTSFAEAPPEAKASVSHRGRAIVQLVEALRAL